MISAIKLYLKDRYINGKAMLAATTLLTIKVVYITMVAAATVLGIINVIS